MPPFMILMISAVKTCFGSYDLRTVPGGLKHGFESRWGHHSEIAEVFAPEFRCREGRDANPYFRPHCSCRTR